VNKENSLVLETEAMAIKQIDNVSLSSTDRNRGEIGGEGKFEYEGN
jgi:hypothetical protein